MKDIEILTRYLPYPYIPHKAFGDAATKKATVWVPGGRKGRPAMPNHLILKNVEESTMVGFMPGAYPNQVTHQHSSDCLIYFVGMDFDTDDTEIAVWLSRAAKTWHHVPTMVRVSASGCGIHMFWRLREPIPCKPDKRQQLVKAITSNILADNKDWRAEKYLCSRDYRVFWFYGGAQDTLWSQETDLIVPDSWLEIMPEEEAYSEPLILQESDWSPEVLSLLKRLTEHGLKLKSGRNQILIRDVFRALQGTPYAFDTVSKMRPGHHETNGWIDISPQEVAIYSCPDGRFVKTLRSKDKFLAILGGNDGTATE